MRSKTTFEFAKRWFHRGVEISPFPIHALHESLTFPLGLVETFRTAGEKGWLLPKTGTGPGSVQQLLRSHGINPAFARKICKNYAICTSFPSKLEVSDDCRWELVRFLREIGVDVSCNAWRSQASEIMERWAPLAAGEMFNEDLEAIEPIHQSIEDADVMTRNPQMGDFMMIFDLDELADPGTDQPATPPQDLETSDYHPCHNLLKQSHEQMMEILTGFGEDGSWNGLEASFKLHPTIRLLSSEALRKERSFVRILKAKSRFITKLQRLITAGPKSFPDEA